MRMFLITFVVAIAWTSAWAGIAQNSWSEAKYSAGGRDDMGRRALFMLDMYRRSDGNFPFALSISHLTLGIERSSYITPKAQKLFSALGMKRLQADMQSWGTGLRELNRYMFTRIYFTFQWGEKLALAGESFPRSNPFSPEEELYQIYPQVSPLFEVVEEILEARYSGVKLDERVTDEHFEVFVDWEHRFTLQTPLVEIYNQLDSLFKHSLRHVPYRIVEKLFITPFTGLRTTLSLNCFETKSFLRTPDFLDYRERIKQARRFYALMKDIDFDPHMSCYNDDYYVTKYPEELFQNTEAFLENLRR